MSVEANKAVIRRLIDEVVNAGNLDAVDELLAPNFVNHNPLPGVTPDRNGFKQAFRNLRAAFPDLRALSADLIAEGDRVVAPEDSKEHTMDRSWVCLLLGGTSSLTA